MRDSMCSVLSLQIFTAGTGFGVLIMDLLGCCQYLKEINKTKKKRKEIEIVGNKDGPQGRHEQKVYLNQRLYIKSGCSHLYIAD